MFGKLRVYNISLMSCIIMLAISVTTCIVPLNGESTVIDIIKTYPNLFIPDTVILTFGFVFIMLLIICLFLMLMNNYTNFQKQFYFYFIFTCIFQIVWNLASSFNYIALSLMLSLTGFGNLVMMNRIIAQEEIAVKWKKFVRIPFQLYLGWQIIFTASNAIILFTSIGFVETDSMEVLSTLFLIVFVTLLSIFIIFRYHFMIFSVFIVSSYIDILVRYNAKHELNEKYPYINLVIISCITILIGIMLCKLCLFLKRNKVR